MKKQEDDNVDNIYFNAIFDHNRIDSTPIPANFKQTRTVPILDKCSDYFCSIIKFDIPLDAVPLMIMPIIPNQPNPNLTVFVIGIRTGGIDYSVPVQYIVSSPFTPPIQNQPTQVITQYYYIYDYETLLISVNSALFQAFINSGLAGNAPYFYLDASTQLIKLVVDIANFAPNQVGPVITNPVATIYMNANLQNYFESFYYNFIQYNSPTGRELELNLTRYGLDNTIPPFSLAATQKVFSEDFSTLGLWTSLRKILIISSSISAIPEFTPGNNSGINSTLPIISDFTPQIEIASQTRSVAYYVPQGQYKLINMQSDLPLYTIDLKIYWQDKDQNIYPLYISSNQQASVKIGFFKKSLYKGYLDLKKYV